MTAWVRSPRWNESTPDAPRRQPTPWRTAGELMRPYRRSHRAIGIADYLIAVTAITTGHLLATLNVRHFPRFEHLQDPFSFEPDPAARTANPASSTTALASCSPDASCDSRWARSPGGARPIVGW